MLVDGFDDIWVSIKPLSVVLPEVPWRQQQAAVFWQQVPQLLEARQKICYLQANLLQAFDTRTERQRLDTAGDGAALTNPTHPPPNTIMLWLFLFIM